MVKENLQLKTTNGSTKLKCTKYVELKRWEIIFGINYMYNRYNYVENNSLELATHNLQMVFLGNSGFPFPSANWPRREISPAKWKTGLIVRSSHICRRPPHSRGTEWECLNGKWACSWSNARGTVKRIAPISTRPAAYAAFAT